MAMTHGMEIAFGGVVVNAEGKVLLRKPKNEFDGYAWTFAKGRPKPGQSPEEAALCEVEEETGWVCEIVQKIPGSFPGILPSPTPQELNSPDAVTTLGQ